MLDSGDDRLDAEKVSSEADRIPTLGAAPRGGDASMSEMIGTYRDAGLVDGVKATLQLIATTSGWRGHAVLDSSELSDEL